MVLAHGTALMEVQLIFNMFCSSLDKFEKQSCRTYFGTMESNSK